MNMSWNRIEGNWKQLKGIARQKWGKLTDDHLDVINGRREQLAGKLQELYGISQEEADEQINEFAVSLHDHEDEFEADYEIQARNRRR